METCFDKIEEKEGDKTKTNYQPIMIEMSLERGVIANKTDKSTPPNPTGELEIKAVTMKFNLPLITIIPINSLGVDNVDVTFEMEVKSSYSS